MAAPARDVHQFGGSYRPLVDPLTDEPILAAGSRNVLLRGDRLVPESWRGMAAASSGAGSDTMMVVGSTSGGLTTGTIILWRNNSIWWIGTGQVYYNGSALGGATGQPLLQVRLTSGAIYTAGIPTPSFGANALQVSNQASTAMRGIYALRFSEGRGETGAESNGSAPSNAKNITNFKGVVTFPPIQAGVDRRFLYGSPRGLGEYGPFQYLTNVGAILVGNGAGQVPASGGQYVFEYLDNQLGKTFAPEDNDYQPTSGGSFVAALESVMVLFGTYGGAGISPSPPLVPEAFPPEYTLFAAPFETITAVWPRSSDGFVLFSTANSLQTVYLSGDPNAPCAQRTNWGAVGVAHNRAGCFVGRYFFCYSSYGPAILTDDNAPEHRFARDVWDEMRLNFDPATACTGYDPATASVVFCGQLTTEAGQPWVAYPYLLRYGVWGVPLEIGSRPYAALTYGGQLYLVQNGGLRKWNAGAGSVWKIRTPFRNAGLPEIRKTWRRARTTGSSDQITCKLYTNLDLSAAADQWSANTGDGEVTPIYVTQAFSHSFEFSGAGAGQSVYQTDLRGYVDPRMREAA